MEHAKRASATKSGPGRYHADGHKRATAPKSKGAPAGFEQHHASKAKKLRREGVAIFGRRQFIKADKFDRRSPLPRRACGLTTCAPTP